VASVLIAMPFAYGVAVERLEVLGQPAVARVAAELGCGRGRQAERGERNEPESRPAAGIPAEPLGAGGFLGVTQRQEGCLALRGERGSGGEEQRESFGVRSVELGADDRRDLRGARLESDRGIAAMPNCDSVAIAEADTACAIAAGDMQARATCASVLG